MIRGAAALAAALATAVVGGLGWILAQGRYLEDYCLTRAPLPEGAVERALVRGPSYDSPVHLRCDWVGLPDVVVLDPAPALGAVVVVLAAVAVGGLVWRRTRTHGEYHGVCDH